ncbi:MAG: hypothetical protein AB1476_05855 [Candidatus Hadarchaeota archaeon]
MRIFKAVLSALLVITFIALLASAYTQYKTNLAVAGLVDASSSIANHLVLETLAYQQGSSVKEYVVDASKLQSVGFTQEIGGENFEFQITLNYMAGVERTLGPYGSAPPAQKAVSTISIPVSVFDNYRFEAGKMELKVWRI